MKQKQARKLARQGKPIRQVAVLPFRRGADGLEVMLLTSRQTRRFVIPKGWPMRRRTDWDAAALEAKQEAGLVGKVVARPLGAYDYWKRLSSVFVHVTVVVYPLEVEKERVQWREQAVRLRRWLSPGQAAQLVDEPGLAALIESFPEAASGRT
jgi:8-oxo-dGTP pyrophosphatase MutT (NUDIX family)